MATTSLENPISPAVTIVIVSYNGWRDTQECLESLLKSRYSNFEIVVVDNGSSDESIQHLMAWAEGEEEALVDNVTLAHLSKPPIGKPLRYQVINSSMSIVKANSMGDGRLPRIAFIRSEENLGFAGGNNLGVRYVSSVGGCEYFWFLNNDTVVSPGTLSALVNKATTYRKARKKVGLIGCKLKYYGRPELIQAVGGRYNKWLASTTHVGAFEHDAGQYDREDVVAGIDYPIGASLFARADFLHDVGPMCEDYFLYFEELDWAHRAVLKDWQTGYCWDVDIFHKEGSTVGAGVTSDLKSEVADFYFMRSRLIFTRKFYPKQLSIVRISFIGVLLNRIKRHQLERTRLILRALLGKTLN